MRTNITVLLSITKVLGCTDSITCLSYIFLLSKYITQRHNFIHCTMIVQDAGVTILGTVPSLVKSWKSTRCMEGLDWAKIK